MALTRIKSSNIADETVVAADLADGSITDAKIQTGISSSKLTGNLPAVSGAALTNLTSANLTGALPAISGANLTGVSTDTSAMENNIAILAFKTQSANNLAKFNLIDQVIDEYKDATGFTSASSLVGQVGSTAADGYLSSVVPADLTVNLGTEIDSGFSYANVGNVTNSTSHLINNLWNANVTWTFRDTETGYTDVSGDIGEFGSHSTFYKATAFDFGGIMFWSGHSQSLGSLACKDVGIYTSTDTTNGLNGTWTIQTPVVFTPSTITGSTFQWRGQRTSQLSANHFILSGIEQPGSRDVANADTVAVAKQSVKGVRIDVRTAWQYDGFFPNQAPHMVEIEMYDDMDVNALIENAAGTAISTTNTALTSPTTGDICMLIENNVGTATLGTHLKAFVSRNGGTNWYEATGDYALTDVGTWGSGTKKIITANNIPFAGPAGTDIRYKIEWAGQSAASKVTRVHATSLAWA